MLVRTLLGGLALACLSFAAPAQLPAPPPQLDFLAGSWTLHDPAGAQIGRSRIAFQAPNAMLFEERTIGAAAMQPLWFSNMERDGRWTQLFVGARGLIREFSAQTPPGQWPLVMGADLISREGGPIRFRLTMTRVSADETRRLLEASRNGGASWSTTFDYIYRRVPGHAAGR